MNRVLTNIMADPFDDGKSFNLELEFKKEGDKLTDFRNLVRVTQSFKAGMSASSVRDALVKMTQEVIAKAEK